MRIVFVDNLLFEQQGERAETTLQPHLGLISLIAVARAGGHESVLYDPKLALTRGGMRLDADLYRSLADELLALSPDAVGLTSLGCNFICTVNIARHLKARRPDLPILLGGPHATVLAQPILERFPCFDLVVRNEAEQTLLPVLSRLDTRSFGDVAGVSWRDRGLVRQTAGAPLIEDLDTLPFPAYDCYPIADLGLDVLRVDAGRGCPFTCTFCSTASFFGRSYRLKSAARLVDELDRLHQIYGVRKFSLQHDLFTVNRTKVMEFCEAVRDRGFTWKCSARMDCVDSELLGRMSEAGCSEIYFGIETGSTRLQHISEKRLDLRLFHPTLDIVDRLKIRATVSFITGYPQEELSDQEDTLDMIGTCFAREPPPSNTQLHLMTPEPGTQLLADFSDSLAYDGYVTDFNFPALDPLDSGTIRGNPDIFVNHHFFEGKLERRHHVKVVSLYYVLYELSAPVLAFILDGYDGRLSRLVADIVESVSGDAIGRAEVTAWFRTRWGEAHVYTSLVRYMLEMAAVRHTVPRHGTSAGGAELVLSERAVILEAIHDCAQLLAELENQRQARRNPAGPLPELPRSDGSLVRIRRGPMSRGDAPVEVPQFSWSATHVASEGDLRDYVVLVSPERGTARNFLIDQPTAKVLRFFRQPATLEAAKRKFGARSRKLIAELRAAGVLEDSVPVSETQRPALIARHG
jgi:hypothetical protein